MILGDAKDVGKLKIFLRLWAPFLRSRLVLCPIFTYLGLPQRRPQQSACIVEFSIEGFLLQLCTPSQGLASLRDF